MSKTADAWTSFPHPLPGEKIFAGFISKGEAVFVVPGTWTWRKDHYAKISDEGVSYLLPKRVFRHDGRYYEWAPLMDRSGVKIYYVIRLPD